MSVRRCLLLVALLLGDAGSARACSVPFFRYALERWTPDPYEIVIFHRGPMKEADEALAKRLAGMGKSQGGKANLEVTLVDVDGDMDRDQKQLWEAQITPRMPWMVARLPRAANNAETVWATRLSVKSIDALTQSPLRRTIASELLKGETAVWLLLESGDAAQDAAAEKLLRARLKRMTDTLKLPELKPDDPEDRIAVGPGAPPLKVSFTLHRVSRQDFAEEPLVQMLLHSDKDLASVEAPLAFPIFGRGRVLLVLEAEGINNETVERACALLAAPCTCKTKRQAPGCDLLFAVHWDEHFSAPRPTPAPEPMSTTPTEMVVVEAEPVPPADAGLKTLFFVLLGGVAGTMGVGFALGKWRR